MERITARNGILVWFGSIDTEDEINLYEAMTAINKIVKGGEKRRRKWLRVFSERLYQPHCKNISLAWGAAWWKATQNKPTPKQYKDLSLILGFDVIGANTLKQLVTTWNREKVKK